MAHFLGAHAVQGLQSSPEAWEVAAGSHRADSVQGCVSPHTEVGARDIVGDRSRDDHKRDAQLIKLLPALHQFQAPGVSLRRVARAAMRGEGEVGGGGEETGGHSPQSPQ